MNEMTSRDFDTERTGANTAGGVLVGLDIGGTKTEALIVDDQLNRLA